MNNAWYTSLLGLAIVTLPCLAKHTINLSIHRYPSITDVVDVDKLKATLENPRKIIRKIIRAQLATEAVPGVFATYGGYLGVSDFDGMIRFERKHKDPNLKLLITNTIKPVFMVGRTVHHWEIAEPRNAQQFDVQRKHDTETGAYFWHITPDEVPDDNIVPLESMILFCKPKDMFVPSGITITTGSPQLLLPTVYAKKGIDFAQGALLVLKDRVFYRSMRTTHTQAQQDYWSTHVHPQKKSP